MSRIITDELHRQVVEALVSGQQMSNVAFNWAQNEGRVLTAADCAMLKKVREQWDESAKQVRDSLRASPSAAADAYVIELLIAAGHVSREKVEQARDIAAAHPAAPSGDPSARLKQTPYGPAILLDDIRKAERYEYVRTLTPRQFTELYQRNLNGEGAFDDLVDAAIAVKEAGE